MKRMLVVLLGAAMLLGAACGDDGGDDGGSDAGGTQTTESESPAEEETTTTTSTSGGELAIQGVEFAFQAPPTAPAGKTNIVFENGGKEPHELIMVRLAENAPSVQELIELPEKKAEKYFAGEPVSSEGPIEPGETKEISADLEPGTYGLVCFVESKKEKTPHAFLGMVNTLTVE